MCVLTSSPAVRQPTTPVGEMVVAGTPVNVWRWEDFGEAEFGNVGKHWAFASEAIENVWL